MSQEWCFRHYSSHKLERYRYEIEKKHLEFSARWLYNMNAKLAP